MSSVPIFLRVPVPILGSALLSSACVAFAAIRPCCAGASAFQARLSPGNLFCSPMFALLLPRHNTYLQECTGQREPTYQLNIHDLKLLFLRFAMEQSFSADTGGGGRESNIHLIPYIIHTVLYVLNTSVSQPHGQRPAGPPVPLCPTRSPLSGQPRAVSLDGLLPRGEQELGEARPPDFLSFHCPVASSPHGTRSSWMGGVRGSELTQSLSRAHKV